MVTLPSSYDVWETTKSVILLGGMLSTPGEVWLKVVATIAPGAFSLTNGGHVSPTMFRIESSNMRPVSSSNAK